MTTDFFNIDSVLSEEERAVRDSVRRFVDERVLPVIGTVLCRRARFLARSCRRWRSLGCFGANLPEEYGCAGLNNVAVRSDHAGARARRLGRALVRVRAGVARDVPDLRVRE